jgi:hypothetical protein
LKEEKVDDQTKQVQVNDQNRQVDDQAAMPWQDLCQQAAEEKDSERLMSLVKEISRLLDEQLKQKERPQSAA